MGEVSKVSGNLEVSRLEDLLSGASQVGQEYQAATVGGLVSETGSLVDHVGCLLFHCAGRRRDIAVQLGLGHGHSLSQSLAGATAH